MLQFPTSFDSTARELVGESGLVGGGEYRCYKSGPTFVNGFGFAAARGTGLFLKWVASGSTVLIDEVSAQCSRMDRAEVVGFRVVCNERHVLDI